MLPFNQVQFFDLFSAYNVAIWPSQVVAYGLAGLVLLAIGLGLRRGMAFAFAILALLWAWTGVVYHGLYFARINPAAIAFAVLFTVQAFLFAHCAIARGTRARRDSRLGWALIAFAMVVYPLLNLTLGHDYPRAPSFGVTPCPLVIFTFGIMALSHERLSWLLFAGPLMWAGIGGTAAVLLGVAADYSLPVAAIVAVGANGLKQLAAAIRE